VSVAVLLDNFVSASAQMEQEREEKLYMEKKKSGPVRWSGAEPRMAAGTERDEGGGGGGGRGREGRGVGMENMKGELMFKQTSRLGFPSVHQGELTGPKFNACARTRSPRCATHWTRS
jgi:hypothetical protein